MTTNQSRSGRSRKDQWKQKDKKKRTAASSGSASSARSSRTTSASSGGYRSRSQSSTASVNPVQDSQTKYPAKENGRNQKEKPKSSSPGKGFQGGMSQRSRSGTPRGPVSCYRCGHAGHFGRDCFRYRSSTKRYCPKCERRGMKLFHDPYYCNGSKSSSYRSPSVATRDQRQRELMPKNARTAQ